ncbi:hypothetical protein BGZ76_009368 [Entomortierella beljakovae]|nr:hypothetical protein BGZ76_009368 [Entomortierella beljakovae]
MGNVSSSEHEKFNGLLTRRAKMRVGSISRKKKQQQQQLQLQLQEEKVIKERLHTKEQICDDRPQFPSEPIPFFEPTTLNDTLHEYYYHETSSHRPTSYPESTSLTSRPIQKNQHSTKRFSESQS